MQTAAEVLRLILDHSPGLKIAGTSLLTKPCGGGPVEASPTKGMLPYTQDGILFKTSLLVHAESPLIICWLLRRKTLSCRRNTVFSKPRFSCARNHTYDAEAAKSKVMLSCT